MRVPFRTKLLAVFATAALSLVTLVLASAVIADKVEGHIDNIRRHYLPKMGLRPQLVAQFERMQRGFQDAVAANDREKLAATSDLKRLFLQQLGEAEGAVAPTLATTLAQAVEDFHAAGIQVSGRLISGDTGEAVVAQMSELQARQKRVAELIDKATDFDRAELTNAFTAAAEAQRTGSRVRLAISIVCLIVVLLLSLWISRDVLRSLAHLTAGFRRFGEGDFAAPIPVVSGDELGDLARQANQMSQSLERLESERSSLDWLKAARSGLSEQLRGELEPKEAADNTLAFLCRYLDCPVGALYLADTDGVFRLLGQHALTAADQAQSFRAGESLLGQSVLRTEVTVVPAPADQLRIRSALVEGSPRSIVLVPLLRIGQVVGLLELASLQPWEERKTELLLSVRDSLAITLEVARGRAELRALLQETQRQRSELQQQAQELTKASAYKSQFLANMSHELRTPLNAIIGFAELLHDEEVGPLEEQQKDFLSDVLRSGRHLLQLINDVLDLAKVEAGKLDFRPEKVEPELLVAEVLGILRTTASTKRVHVHSQVDKSVDELLIDPARLKQVLYNYVSNALKFTPEGGTVQIRISAEGEDKFRMEVEDTGKGISPEDLQRLFVEFQQIHDGSDKRHAGTGLGLALTKRLVEAQGGRVGVRSTVGKGSTFFAVLPRRSEKIVPAEAMPRTMNAAGPAILVVEDNPADQNSLAEILGRAGYSVQTAPTGAAALELSRTRSFDAVTLDLLLPDMSGLEVLRQLRINGKNRDVPVVVVTVVAEPGAVAGFSVQDVLPKPIDAAALVASLTRAGVPPNKPGTILVVDDDPGSLKLVATTLKQLGYQTRCERDGEAALRALREELPSAVILDLVMPGMNGFEFLEHLRREPAGRRVPVIVWTVKDLTEEERAFLRRSAQAIVNKGQGGSGVLAELEAVVQRPPLRA
jgi:signal transduction histidine kinase/DNA-binding response OmpR family regulator